MILTADRAHSFLVHLLSHLVLITWKSIWMERGMLLFLWSKKKKKTKRRRKDLCIFIWREKSYYIVTLTTSFVLRKTQNPNLKRRELRLEDHQERGEVSRGGQTGDQRAGKVGSQRSRRQIVNASLFLSLFLSSNWFSYYYYSICQSCFGLQSLRQDVGLVRLPRTHVHRVRNARPFRL